jgi:hypothetical protein
MTDIIAIIMASFLRFLRIRRERGVLTEPMASRSYVESAESGIVEQAKTWDKPSLPQQIPFINRTSASDKEGKGQSPPIIDSNDTRDGLSLSLIRLRFQNGC